MSEKIKCSECYRTYKPTANKRCPGCGQKPVEKMDSGGPQTSDSRIPNVDSESKSKDLDRISDLEYDINSLQSGLRSLAWGVVLIVFSMGAGVAMVTLGATQKIACAVSRVTDCAGDGLVMAGWTVFGLGTLVGLALVVGATTRSNSKD